MKPHYFLQQKPDDTDMYREMAIHHGYVPGTCLMNGKVIMGDVMRDLDPCAICEGPRDKCMGRQYTGSRMTVTGQVKILDDS